MIKKAIFVFMMISFSTLIFSQEIEVSKEVDEEISSKKEKQEDIHPVTGFPQIKSVPFVVFNEGVAFSNVTRIQLQKERSNFVLNDSLLGAYFELQTQNMKPIDSILRVAIFYPLETTFNSVPQQIKQPLTYAFDMFFIPYFESDMWNYVRIKFGPGFHFLYQLTDDWNYVHLGAGALLGVALPVTRGWTVMVDGLASYDYANLGSNRRMMSLDHSWTYQIQAGVRYSKKKSNKYSYIDSKKKN